MGSVLIMLEAGIPKQKTRQEIIEEAYRMFPDVIEPVDYHPIGKIVVDRGNLRFAFLEGAQFAAGRFLK